MSVATDARKTIAEFYVKPLPRRLRPTTRYRRSAVSAWPIRAALERGASDDADTYAAIATRAAQTIELMGGKSAAVFLIDQTVRPFEMRIWLPVLWALVSASERSLA